MEDRKAKDQRSDRPGSERKQGLKQVTAMISALLLIFLAGIVYDQIVNPGERQNSVRVRETEESLVRVIGSEMRQEQIIDIEETEKEVFPAVEIEASKQEIDAFIPMIFDAKGSRLGKGQIKLTGLFQNAKEKLSFREADFVAELTGFLQEYGINVSEIHFEKEIGTSAQNVFAYEIELLGNEKQQLVAFFFPKLPGQYLFALLEKEVQEAGTQEIKQSAGEQKIYMEMPVLSQSGIAVNEKKYDASRITIASIPEKLMNYLDNRYELQYSLYDYMYKNGYRDVTRVTVESYEIDADEKKATVKLRLEEGSQIEGVYDKENNRYVFYD